PTFTPSSKANGFTLSSRLPERLAQSPALTLPRISFAEWGRQTWSRFQQRCLHLSAFSYDFFLGVTQVTLKPHRREKSQSAAQFGPALHISQARLICSAWPPPLCCIPPHQRGRIFNRPLSPVKPSRRGSIGKYSFRVSKSC